METIKSTGNLINQFDDFQGTLKNTKRINADDSQLGFNMRDLISTNETSTKVSCVEGIAKEGSLQETYSHTKWVLDQTFASKVLEINKDNVLLEVVIDKEESLTQDREFERGLFEGYQLSVGSFYRLEIFKRKNGKMISIKDGNGIVSEEDFPTVDFGDLKNSKIFS